MNLRKIFFLFLIIIPVLSYGQPLGFSLPKGVKKVEIPFELVSNLVVIPIILNGQLPLKFILDSGVRTAILTEKVYSDILNLSYSRQYTLSVPGNKRAVKAFLANNVTLDIHEVEGKGHSMLVLSEDYLQLRNLLGIEVHGLLGYELFSRFIVQIDYFSKQVTIWSPEHFKPKRNHSMLPITVFDTKPYLLSEITFTHLNDPFPANLMVDTGASHSFLLEPISDQRIQIPSSYLDCILGYALGGEITGKVARVPKIRIGPYAIKNPIVSFPNPGSYYDSVSFSRSRIPYHGTIGGDLLSRFNVIFDYANNKIYLKNQISLKKKSYYDLSGISLIATEKNLKNCKISYVRENSPADHAGLLVNDIILKINGDSTSQQPLGKTQRILNSRPNRKIKLIIKRDDKLYKVVFRLRNDMQFIRTSM